MRCMSLVLMLVLSCPAASWAVPPAVSVPPSPPTEKRPVKDLIHGVEVIDDYRWLEGDNSNPDQMGKMNDEVSSWTDVQNERTRAVLDNLPGRSALEARLRELMEIGSVSAPAMRGNRYFYTRREGRQNQPRIFVREGYNGEPRLLLDPVAVDPSGLTALGGLAPSRDGKLLGFGLHRAGDENTTLYVLNVDSGVWLTDQIDGKASFIEWMPDNSGFFYRRLADVKNPYSAQIKFHMLGTHPDQDKLLFRQYTREESEQLATTWGPGATVSRDGRWMVLTYWTSTSSNDLWVIDLDQWRKDGTFQKREIKVGAPNTFAGGIEGDTLFMLTNYKAPKKQVYAVDLRNPEEKNWKVVIPERPDAVLTGYGIARGIIAANYEEKAQSQIRLFAMDGKPLGEMRLPGPGTASVSLAHDRTEGFLSFTSFNFPSTIFRIDLARPDAEPAIWERPDVPVDPGIVEVRQVMYPSKDDTQVPMFIVHRKGLKLDGNNPTILSGYGGFNISMTPSFSPTLFPWLESGGVYAVANLRGGGEFGKPWHEAGMRGRKQNVFDDMIAAAEYLVANNYTNPNRLGATGGSNGGLLMGAMMVQRPDLFRAIFCAVPLLDMYRYQHFLMARYWVPEYGAVDETSAGMDEDPSAIGREAFGWLQQWSPYHNIRPGTSFPAVFFTAGENDNRTHPMHARKMAAAMQAATASAPNDRPILLWVDRDAGHGQGKPLDLRVRDATDTRIFFMWQLGML